MLITSIGIPALFALTGWLVSAVTTIQKNVKDLHSWHSPDSGGRQTWKGTDPRLIATLDRLNDTLERNEKHQDKVLEKLEELIETAREFRDTA